MPPLCVPVVGRPYGEPSTESQSLAQALSGAEEARVTIDFALGELHVGDLVDSPNLVEGELDYLQGYEPVIDYRVSEARAQLTLKSQHERLSPGPLHREDGIDWRINLNSEVPLSMALDLGAGRAVLDLSALQIADLSVDGGVGEIEIMFPMASAHTEADIDVGVGEVTLSIPDGVAARIKIDQGLGEVNVAERFVKDGEYYVSEGYDAARNRLDLDVHGGIGSITVD